MNARPKETLEEMLRLLGFQATIDIKDIDDGIRLEIQTDDPGRLIGKQGQTLSQLQYILNRLLYRQDNSMPRVILDVGNYRNKSRQTIVDQAMDAAAKARRYNDIVEMKPMTAFERRIVHNALKDHEHVESKSVEIEGTTKKVIILRPKD